MNKYFIIFLCVCLANVLNASSEESKGLRILDLLPNLCNPLAVEPAVPDDFVAMSPGGDLDPYDWIYWGPKDVLESYFKDPKSLDKPLLRVKLSANVAQRGPSIFIGGDIEYMEDMKNADPESFSDLEYHWGSYPVYAVRAKMEKDKIFSAWVGLNDQEAGWTLLFNLVYPKKAGHPNKDDQNLWDNFIRKTKQLPEPDFFKAHGQDMRPGLTLVDIGGAKLLMVAEKRENDGKVQVMVVPASSDVEFEYLKMEECLLGSEWNLGAPIVKVFGKLINNKLRFISGEVITVLLVTVPEFTNMDEAKNKKELFIYQN